MDAETDISLDHALWIENGDTHHLADLQSGLSRSLRLQTCSNLEAAAKYLTGATPTIVFYAFKEDGFESISSLDEWMQKSLPSAGLILVRQSFSPQQIEKLSQMTSVSCFLDASLGQADVEQALARVHQVASKNRRKMRLAESLKVQNKQLETMTASLERIVKDRTHDIQEQKTQIEIKVNKVKALLAFIKSLSKVNDIGDLSQLLQKEIKSLSKDCEPYLAFRARDFGRWIYTIRQSRLIEKSVQSSWKTGARLRINDKEDQVYLANEFSKPVQKTIAVPLNSNHHQSSEVTLFIEHNLNEKELEQLIDEGGKRAQPLALCLDRALLEIELKRSAYLWESTFNSIDEPIAIVEKPLKPIRSNKAFQDRLEDWFSGLPDAESDLMEHINECFESKKSVSLPLLIEGSFFDLKLYPILSSAVGDVESVVCLFVDMTHEKKLQSQMIQHEKMTAIGHLAGNIAHELNNPLAGLKSLGQIVQQEIDEADQISDDLNEILMAAERSSEIIKNLLEFSNPNEGAQDEIIDLNALVTKTLPLLKSITSNFERDIIEASEPLMVKVNPQLVQQVFFNLVNNACQAMGERGALKIQTLKKANTAQLLVADSGGGIPLEVQAKVFDPFFSTKKEKGGTGLGLSMSRNIVRSYGGEVQFDSRVGEGTTFVVSFPIEKN